MNLEKKPLRKLTNIQKIRLKEENLLPVFDIILENPDAILKCSDRLVNELQHFFNYELDKYVPIK